MNPLERALARRRVLGARLSIVALVLLVGSSGVVVPKLDGQRQARTRLMAELETYESTLQLVADLRQFERDGVQAFDRARAELATFVPPPLSRTELRSMLDERAASAGVADLSIEISAPEPFSLTELLEGEEAPLLSTTVIVTGKSEFECLLRFVHTLGNPRPLILIRQASFERELDSEDDGEFGQVNFSLRLAFIHSPTPTRAADPEAVGSEVVPATQPVDAHAEHER